MSSSFTVRRGTSKDLHALVQLTKDLATETEDGLQLSHERLLLGVAKGLPNPNGPTSASDLSPKYWVACDQVGHLVGFVGVSPEWSDWWATCYWWVISVFVDSKWRRAGVGTALFKTMQQDAIKEDVQTVNLRVETNNTGAQNFYRKIGFAVDSSHLVMSRGRRPDGKEVGNENTTTGSEPEEKNNTNMNNTRNTKTTSFFNKRLPTELVRHIFSYHDFQEMEEFDFRCICTHFHDVLLIPRSIAVGTNGGPWKRRSLSAAIHLLKSMSERDIPVCIKEIQMLEMSSIEIGYGEWDNTINIPYSGITISGYTDNEGKRPTILDKIFTFDTDSEDIASTLILKELHLSGRIAQEGLICYGATHVTATDCLFSLFYESAVVLDHTNCILDATRCTFDGCSSKAIVVTEGGKVKLTDCVFERNKCDIFMCQPVDYMTDERYCNLERCSSEIQIYGSSTRFGIENRPVSNPFIGYESILNFFGSEILDDERTGVVVDYYRSTIQLFLPESHETAKLFKTNENARYYVNLDTLIGEELRGVVLQTSKN